MSSYSKNTTPSKKESASPVKRQEVASRPTYFELWEKGMKCGLISPERPSKPIYYHFIYRKALERALQEYEEADKKTRIELSKKFEAVIVRESRKMALWQEGLETGLIDEKWPFVCDERNYYTTFPLQELETAIKAYNEAYEKDNNDVETFDRMAEAFSKRLETGLSTQTTFTKNIPVKRTITVVNKATYVPPTDSTFNWAALAGKAQSSTENKSVSRRPDAPTEAHSSREEYSDISIALIAEWNEAIRAGLISTKNSFHRSIPSFITISELRSLLKVYTTSDKETRAALKSQLNDELDEFNENIPSISRAFKVTRTYADIWREADAAGIIPEDFDFSIDFAEWLPAKDLVSYVQSIATMMHRKERQALRSVFLNSISERLEAASAILLFRVDLRAMSLKDLVAYSVEKRISSREVVYSDCNCCSKLLDKTDLICALSSWIYDSDNLAKARYLRWHAYRKHLHSEKCAE